MSLALYCDAADGFSHEPLNCGRRKLGMLLKIELKKREV